MFFEDFLKRRGKITDHFLYLCHSLQIMVAIPSAAFLIIFPPLWGILAVWAGLTLIMSLRLGVGLWRYKFSPSRSTLLPSNLFFIYVDNCLCISYAQ